MADPIRSVDLFAAAIAAMGRGENPLSDTFFATHQVSGLEGAALAGHIAQGAVLSTWVINHPEQASAMFIRVALAVDDAKHVCHAAGCRTPVHPKMFMCRPHWFRLPKPMRDAIWAAYRPGQEIRKDPSPEYIKAARAAIDHIAQLEAA